MLVDFMVKCKIGKINLYLTENRFYRNEIWCAAYNHNQMCHVCESTPLNKLAVADVVWARMPVDSLNMTLA